jgi:hypothetical protein
MHDKVTVRTCMYIFKLLTSNYKRDLDLQGRDIWVFVATHRLDVVDIYA